MRKNIDVGGNNKEIKKKRKNVEKEKMRLKAKEADKKATIKKTKEGEKIAIQQGAERKRATKRTTIKEETGALITAEQRRCKVCISFLAN